MKDFRYRVIKRHQTSDLEPLIITKGEILSYELKETEWSGWVWCTNKQGKTGWAPEAYLKMQKTTCEALQDYNAIELTANIGEELIIKKEESGWFWVVNDQGKEGWIPIKNVQLIE